MSTATTTAFQDRYISDGALSQPRARLVGTSTTDILCAQTEDSVLGEDPQRERDYRTELVRLGRQRDAFAAIAAAEPDPRELVTLAGQGRSGDAERRRAVLSALFEKIHMRERKVIGYTPRADRASRVSLLVSTAFDYATDGPGAAKPRVNGRGGIRTLGWPIPVWRPSVAR